MMTKAVKNIMIRVIKNRMKDGEKFEEIIKTYPGLSEEEVTELKEAVGV